MFQSFFSLVIGLTENQTSQSSFIHHPPYRLAFLVYGNRKFLKQELYTNVNSPPYSAETKKLFIYIHDTKVQFSQETDKLFSEHYLLPGLQPWLHQVCRKMFFPTTDANVVENFILHDIIYSFNKFYFIYFKMLLYHCCYG